MYVGGIVKGKRFITRLQDPEGIHRLQLEV